MTKNFTTSLLVPCYNAERFLPRLREQMDRLAPQFDEVLLADDASTDNTASVAESLGFKTLRLSQNLGPGGARNELARMATGTWIHFHDVDDEIASNYLDRVRPSATDDCDMVLHFTDFLDEQSRKLLIRWKFDSSDLKSDPESTLLQGPLPTMSSFIRRSFFNEIGGFDQQRRCFEDGDLHFRIAVHQARINSVPEVLEFSLRHDGGAGSNQHYCFLCRLEFLEDYANTISTKLRHALAREAEKTATMLLRSDDIPNARRAIALAQRHGLRLPDTRNTIMRILRLFIPTEILLKWQDRHRRPQ